MKHLSKILCIFLPSIACVAPILPLVSCGKNDKQQPKVESVQVIGDTTLNRNESRKYSVNVVASKDCSHDVEWTFDKGTTDAIFNNETLTITSFTKSGTIKLTATSLIDKTKTSTLNITITDAPYNKTHYYFSEDMTARLIGVEFVNNNLYIPEKIINSADEQIYTVTIIGEKIIEGNKDIEKIFLPDSIERIENRAFNECNNLHNQELKLPKNLKFIGDFAFRGTKINNVVISSLVEEIGESAFGKNHELINIKVDNNNSHFSSHDDNYGECNCIVKKINSSLIMSATNAEHIPSYVKVIADGAFDNIATNVSIIPQGVTTIEKEAFLGAALKKGINIPSSVNTIGANAFTCDVSLVYFHCIFDTWPETFDKKMFQLCTLAGNFYSTSEKINDLVKTNITDLKNWTFHIIE